MQQLETAGKRRRGFARVDQFRDDFQSAHKIGKEIRLSEAAMAAGILRINAGNIAGDIEDAEPLEVNQLCGNLAATPAVSQPHVDDGKIR